MMNPVYTLPQLAEFAQSGGLKWKVIDKKRSTSGSSKSGYKMVVQNKDFAVQLGSFGTDETQRYTILTDTAGKKSATGAPQKMISVLLEIAKADVAAAKVLREWFYASIKADGVVADATTLDAVKAKVRTPFVFATDPDTGSAAGGSSSLPKHDAVWVRWKMAGSAYPTRFECHSLDDSGKSAYSLYDYARVQREQHPVSVATFWPLEEYEGMWSSNFVAERVTLDSSECNFDESYVPPPRTAGGGSFRPPQCLPWFNNGEAGFFAFGGTDNLAPTWVGDAAATYTRPLSIEETGSSIAAKRVDISDVKFTKEDGTQLMKHYINYADVKGSMTTALADLSSDTDDLPFVSCPPSKYVPKLGGMPAPAEDEPKSLSMLVSFPSKKDIEGLRALGTATKLLLVDHFDSPALARETIQKRNPAKSAEFIEERVQAHINDKLKMIKLPTSDPEDMMADYTAARQVVQKEDGSYMYEATPDKPEKVVHFSASMRVSADNSTDRRLTRVFQLNAKNEPFSATQLGNESSLTRARALVPVVEWRDISQKDKIYRASWFMTYGFTLPSAARAPAWGFIGEDTDVAASSPHE